LGVHAQNLVSSESYAVQLLQMLRLPRAQNSFFKYAELLV
jgi:hypothetical protein